MVLLGLIGVPAVFPDGALMGAEPDSAQITSLKVIQLATCLILHLYTAMVFILAISTARKIEDNQDII